MNQQSLDGMRILIVEDVSAIRTLVSRLLQGQGCERVYEAGTLDEAAEILGREDCDALLLDYELNHENGLKLLKRMRRSADPRQVNLPVILLTAHAEAEIVQAAAHAGADGYLVKPVRPERLAERILAAIAARREKTEAAGAPTEVVWSRRGS
ncbi:response regulator [Maricaulis sp. D1M11]|uniref:response regulator n=1 Tax=Maricaulis sp. D1M11 TaxID=3076117 RepID=UPI0039B68BA3